VFFKTVPVPGDDNMGSDDSDEVALPPGLAIDAAIKTPYALAVSTLPL
jgi:hypothetical protein